MDKKNAIIEIVNSITDEGTIDFVYGMVNYAYLKSCCVSEQEQSPADSESAH